MATTKKTTKKAASTKKASTKKASGKKTKKRGAASSGRRQEGKGTIVFFMGKLIQAGLLGEEVPEDAKEQKRAAMLVRQMAEKLARQTRKFGDEDVPLGESEDD